VLDLPKTVERQPVPQTLLRPLLSALTQDPIAEAAPYLSRLNAEGSVDEFASLLGSGEVDLVFAAYEALYRKDRSTAFGSLLAEMDRVKTSDQSQAIGDMLLRRHANRPDGFYLKFANDMSGDQARSVPARASGLHAVLISNPDVMPEFTFARAEALRFLVKGQPFVVQDKYLSVLKRMKAEQELNLIWKIASEEKWINRDRIAEAFNGLKSDAKDWLNQMPFFDSAWLKADNNSRVVLDRKYSTDISAYSVDLSSGFPTIKHLGAIPNSARDFSVAPNGDLLMNFKGGTQAPIRMSPRGDISLACRSLQPVTAAPAPN